ncbi:putative calcium-transporting ATPase 13, plasma membrane-type [Cinnamomum micranthum f. kanehirae]|uniref:Calcium-transporting ATPase n=1 Tax=Cinnamomum micranthum f. kanehirae TaxID=337451 RepID=A0A3S4Q1T9_9MAGN|nr:putative calcium-transporting ATPase 13, plasma membrane-type [Cinnamomum micranthum f. kanehirae]
MLRTAVDYCDIVVWCSIIIKFQEQWRELYYKGDLLADLDFITRNNLPFICYYHSDKAIDFLKIGGVQGIARALETNIEKGIHGKEDDVARRKAEFGMNAYRKQRTRTFFFFSLKAFKDHKILFLLVYAIFSLAFGIKNDGLKEGLSDGGRIFLVISLAATISAAREFCAELIMMSNMSSNINVKVMRNGSCQNTSIFNVVVGDVVLLQTGDHIPADGLFLKGDSLQVTNSSMVGHQQNVDYYNPYLSAGGKVAAGSGSMLVTSVGTDTSWGGMMSSSYCDFYFDEKTPLQVRLLKLTWWIRWIVLSISILILGVMLVRYWMRIQEIDGNEKSKNEVMKSMLRIFTAAITMPVMVIPEGWPIIVTLTFAYLRRTVMGNHALFWNLSALETLGTVTTICTEKMDMLKLDEVKVTKFCVGEEALTGGSHAIDNKVLSLLCQAVGVNSTGAVSATSKTQYFVSPIITKAILHWATSELGMDMENFRRFYTILDFDRFNTNKKGRQVLLRETKTTNKCVHVHWEGTAEMIVSMCYHYYTKEGIVKVINQERRCRFEETIQGMAAHYIQCIAFAHKYAKSVQSNEEESGFTLLALVGLKKRCPSEPNVRMPVEAFAFAGVDVKMITREDAYTAGLIATECGILHADQDGAVVGGQEFRSHTDDQRMDMVDQIRVMTNSSRPDKILMVECLKQRGQIVAHMEDYEDDLLTKSNVRVLTSSSGSRTGRRNSDIVILNDGFASIEKLLRCGRCIYENARNFLQFQLTVIIVTLVVNCVTAVTTYKIEISAVQILWESLLLETIGALACAAERPTKELMLKGPVSLEETLITSIMWRNIISQALYQIILLLVLQFKSSSIFHVDGSVSDTLIFNTFVLCQVFNLFNSRNLEKRNMFEGIQDNRLFLWIVGMIVSLQVLMVELLYKFACIERLDWRLWAASVGMAAVSWPIAFVVKGIPISNVAKALQHLCSIFNSFLKSITVGTRRKEWTHIL